MAKTTDGYELSPSFFPVRTMNHCIGSTLNPYLIKFSKSNRNPPIVRRRNPQFTRLKIIFFFQKYKIEELTRSNRH